MGWEKEYEHWRDRGHTWGPGIDDREELSESKITEIEARRKAFEEKINSLCVEPSEEARKSAMKLESFRPSDSEISSGTAPYDWRDKYFKAKLDFAKSLAQNMGYELKLREWKDRDENKFMVSVEYHGYIPGRQGNIHDFSVVNIKSIDDCLQLVADFSKIGYWPTTWYKNNHISMKNTGELRLEMKGWGFPLEEKPSLADKIKSASYQANVVLLSKNERGKEAEPEI